VVVRGGRRFSRYVSPGGWGGREQARLAAQHFLARLALRIEADTRVRRRPPKGSRSKTGMPGVRLERYRVGRRFYWRYVALWPDPEKRFGRRRFGVSRYGKGKALALAVQARRAGVSRYRDYLRARQREEARQWLKNAPPMPRQVKDPLSRKGIKMGRRRPRRAN
jgi:hypothetical protein